MGRDYDVAVIGAGVVGAAIARELLGYELSVAVIEARDDVGDGTSKANTALLHTGFDATPGTLESRLVRRGYELLGAYAGRTGEQVSPAHARETLTREDRRVERVLLETRLSTGLDPAVLDDVGRQAVPELVARGLLAETTGRLVPTREGRLLADAVVRDLLP